MPNRILRDWTTSESIDKLSQGAEVFFTRLIMKADDFGNYTANIKLLKAALFPLKDYSDITIQGWLTECSAAGVIEKYEVSGRDYIHIPNFGQRLRAMKSQYPAKCQTPDGHLPADGLPETNRNETELEKNAKNGIVELGSGDKFFLIVPETANSIKYRIRGVSGLKEYVEMNQSILPNPELHSKFLMTVEGDHFRDFMHLKNKFNLFVKNQYK